MTANVFPNFQKIYLEITGLNPAHFHSAPGLAGQAALKEKKVKLDLLTDVDMLIMVEKRISFGICFTVYQYATAKNKFMNDYDKNKESSYLNYRGVNN